MLGFSIFKDGENSHSSFRIRKRKILDMWVFFLVFQVLCQTGEASRFTQTAAGSLS